MSISIIPIHDVPLIKAGDDVAQIIIDSLKKMGMHLEDKDIFVIASTIISKAEGQVTELKNIEPSEKALDVAKITGKDPRLCEVILRSSYNIIRASRGVLITETKLGFICASAGVDASNVAGNSEIVCTLPKDPDTTAMDIRNKIESEFGVKISVIVSDTHGRPFRKGAIDVCIGLSGMEPLKAFKGDKDMYGYELKSSLIGRADEVASAAGLLMGQSNEGFPVVVVRGVDYSPSDFANARDIIREKEKDLFR